MLGPRSSARGAVLQDAIQLRVPPLQRFTTLRQHLHVVVSARDPGHDMAEDVLAHAVGDFVLTHPRLDRVAEAVEKDVRIYDYVDRAFPMLARMFEKRRRAYAAIGYRADGEVSPATERSLTIDYRDI